MLCAMDANEHEFVFHAGRRHFMTINADVNLPSEEFLDRKRTRKVAQRQVIVEFDQQFRVGIGKKVLPRNLAGVNGAKRNGRLVARGN